MRRFAGNWFRIVRFYVYLHSTPYGGAPLLSLIGSGIHISGPPHCRQEQAVTISINTVAGSKSSTFNPASNASKLASKIFKDLDPENKGSVTKDQFVSKLTSKGISSKDASAAFDSIDTKKTGSITQADLESSIKSGSFKPPAGGPPGAARGPGRPGGGAGGPGGAGGGSSSKTYDAADTNKDGTVSAQEATIYALKHPTKATSATTDTSKLGNKVDQLV